MHFSYDLKPLEEAWFEGLKCLKQFPLIDSEIFLNKALAEGKKILAEGAQGTMLDIDFGSYPYVTSSNTICAGACTGLGIPPRRIGRVYGIFKAYCTRVGSGPFPTELNDATGQLLRDKGFEYGSVTGRPRRCGWLDLVALRYSIMINGVTDLIMMKSDVLDSFDRIQICTAYRISGKETADFPFDLSVGVEPIYTDLPGWKCSLKEVAEEKDFPEAFLNYIHFIETFVGVPIRLVSVGPDRTQTIIRQ